MTLDELRPLEGSEVGVSDWWVVTQDMIAGFAEVSGDRQWIHTHVDRAREESPYGATVAHGFLTLSLLTCLVADAVVVSGDFKFSVNYGFDRVRFPAPVMAGSKLRARVTLNALKERPEHVEITWGVILERECGGKPALVADWLVRKYL
ncbi:MAG: MaoC family dehydratase [Candidatus Solibacter sp.]